MKVRLTFDLNVSAGEYELVVNNLTNPGESIDLTAAMDVLRRILLDVEKKADAPTLDGSATWTQ